MPITASTCRSMFTKSSSPSRMTAVRPFSSGAGGDPPWSVSQNRLSRWLREPSAMTTSSSWVSSSRPCAAPVACSTRPNAARMPPAFACVSATSYDATESRTSVAPAVTFSSPDGLTSAVRMTIGESAVARPDGSRPSSASAAP